MKYLIRYLFGGYRLKIVCTNPAAALGAVMNKFAGAIYDVKVCDGYIIISCFSHVKKRIATELNRDGFEIVEVDSLGVVKAYRRMKSRPGIVLGVIVSVMLVYLQTIPVWEIRVSGNKTIDDREIIDTLSSVGFSVGKPKQNERLSDYANKLIMLDHRLSRASINMSGNIAFVEVGERTETVESDIPSSMTGLYSTRDAIIELPVAQKGESVVRKGDIVYKGQLLISPVILGDNNVEYIVGAEGKVLAKTEDIFYAVVRYENHIANPTEKVSSDKIYSFLGKCFSAKLPSPNRENRLCKRKMNRFMLLNRFELPIDIENILNFEYELNNLTLSEEEAKQKAYDIIYTRISEEKGNAEILSFVYSETRTDDYFILKCNVECIENIASASFE